MAKKQASKKKLEVTFEVRFVGPGLAPETIPLRSVSDALAAVQDLASGRDPFETTSVPPEQAIGLVDVKEGSAIYRCVSRAPAAALDNLRHVGAILAHNENGAPERDLDRTIAALRPIESLSDIARILKCQVQVRVNRNRTLFSVDPSDYERISHHLLITGETTVIGQVQRVGGATKNRCLLRVPGRPRGLYCDVESRQLARDLGKHMYEDIVAYGEATWLHQSWRIFKFRISSFKQPRIGRADDALKELRSAGLDAWDEIEDPEAYLNEVPS